MNEIPAEENNNLENFESTAESAEIFDETENETAPEIGEKAVASDNMSELLGELAKEDSTYLEQGEVKVKKRVSKTVIIVIIAAVLAAAGIVAGLLLWANPPRTGAIGNTSANLSNGGYAAFDGERTYYTSVSTTESKDASGASTADAVFSIKTTDGSGDKLLVKDGGYCLNVVGNYVYFIKPDDGCIYRVKKDGSGAEKLSSEQCASMSVRGNYIYYIGSSDLGVYSMRVNGGKTQRISPDGLQVYQIALEEDAIYYISGTDRVVYKTDYNFNAPKLIINEPQGMRFTMSSKNIYYTVVNNQTDLSKPDKDAAQITVYMADKNGENRSKVVDDAVYSFAFNDYLYYADFDGYICRQAGNAQSIAKSEKFKNKGIYFNEAGGKIYYQSADEDGLGYIYRMNPDGTDVERV